MYISIAGEDRIAIWNMDPRTGRLTFQEDISLDGAPGPLAVSPGRQFLYAGLRSTRHIASFGIDRATGSLSPIATTPLESDPCYMITDRTGKFLLSSYYRAGVVSVHSLGRDGSVGSTPIEWRSTAPKAHSIQTDPSNRYAFVPHVMDANLILQFEFDERTGTLQPNHTPQAIPVEGAGPRHFCFHPSRNDVYFVNEQGCSVTAYRFNPSAGTLVPFQTTSTLPEGFVGENTCAQIHIAPSGRFLYASNRGHDSIACFSIDSSTGQLTAIGHQPTEKTPRAFSLDPQGNYLFVASMASGRLAAYRIKNRVKNRVKTGMGTLSPLETYQVGERPMWVLILKGKR
jgi:6-phosphogluconolactonase